MANQKGPKGLVVVNAAADLIDSSERAFKKDPNAAIRALEQAYLLGSEHVKGGKRREYLKRAALLRMLLDELEGKGKATGSSPAFIPRSGFVPPGLGKHLSHGFYAITDAEAKKLAHGVQRPLPDFGRELRVELPDGRLAWLQRTPHSGPPEVFERGWVWAVYGFKGG